MQTKILNFLKETDGHISGEEISRHIKISRAGIWKYIQELRREGYDILAVPHLGYKLESVPDKLFADEIQYKLDTKIVGKRVISYESIDSTMDAAFHLGLQGEPEGTVVCAETQEKGRGRQGRAWSSPKGKGVYMSILLRPNLSPSDVAQITLLSAVAVCEAVREIARVDVKIKWPNDLLYEGKKIAGILTELNAEMDGVRFVVIGIGINVNTQKNHLPEEGTSLKVITKESISRVQLSQAILQSVERWYEVSKDKGFDPVLHRWKELSATLGERVTVKDPSGDIEGEALDLDDNGGLIIRGDDGLIVKRMTGDVLIKQSC